MKSTTDQPITIKSEMGKFISLPIAIDDAQLTLIEFRVYVNLARRAGNDDGLAYPSYATIARDCFRTTYETASDATLRRMAMTAIAGLVEKGMLTKHSQTRDNGSAGNNIYTLTLPSKWSTSQPEIPAPTPQPEPKEPAPTEPNTTERGGAYAPPPESADLGGGVVHMHQGGVYAPPKEDPYKERTTTTKTTTDTTAAPLALADEVSQTATTTIAPATATATQTMTDPALMYVTAFGRTLTSTERKMVYQRVTNLPLWEQSLEFWKKENNAPTAVTRLLSTYEIYLKLTAGQPDQKPNLKVVEPRKPDYTLFDPRKFRETGLCAPGTGVTPYEIYREVTRNELSMGVIRLIHDEVKPDTFNAWRNTVTFWSNSGYRMNNIHGMLNNYYDQLGRAQPPPRGTNGWAAAASQGRGNDNQTNIEPVSAERAQLLAEIEAELAAQQSAGAR